MMQENNDFVSFLQRDFVLRKLPKIAFIHFGKEHSVLHLNKLSISFACSPQHLEPWSKGVNTKQLGQVGKKTYRQ